MKKNYIAPAVEISETMVCEMMALSLHLGDADDGPILVVEERNWINTCSEE